MSTAVISYDSLMTSSGVAEKMAGYFNDYAESLRNDVLNKLNSYSGEHTENIGNAISRINNKLDELDKDSERFSKYGKDLSNLKDSCVRTDTMVKNKISSLSQTFCTNHNIRVSAVESTIAYLGVDFINNSPAGRFIGTVAGDAVGTLNSWKRDIEEWYDYEGGKQLIDGIEDIALDVAIIAASIAVVVLSAGAAAPVITVLGAVFAGTSAGLKLGNDYVDAVFEREGYGAAQNGDPVLGRRLRKINTFKQLTFSSVKYGLDMQNYEYGEYERECHREGDIYDIALNASDLGDKFFNKFLGKMCDPKNCLNPLENYTSYFSEFDDPAKTAESIKHTLEYSKKYKEIISASHNPFEFVQYIKDNPTTMKNFVIDNLTMGIERTKVGGVRLSDIGAMFADAENIGNDLYDLKMMNEDMPVHGDFYGKDIVDITKGDANWSTAERLKNGELKLGDIDKINNGKDVSKGLNYIHSVLN